MALSGKPNHCREVTECVTITVKTKGRIGLVKQLIKSARQHYPNIKFVVVDELENNSNENDYRSVDLPPSGVIYVKTKPGIGFGRKMALMLVETKYALVTDYDFVFTARTNLTKMVDLLERSSADIVGGAVGDHAFFDGIFRVADRCDSGRCYPSLHNYAGAFYEQVPLFSHCVVCDRVKNFFLADRQAVLAAGSWDTSRPFFEHEDFFVQMRGSGVTVALCRDVLIDHNTTDRYLAGLRFPDKWLMARHFLLKWGFTAVHECSLHMYPLQTCCESCREIGPHLEPQEGNPAKAFKVNLTSEYRRPEITPSASGGYYKTTWISQTRRNSRS